MAADLGLHPVTGIESPLAATPTSPTLGCSRRRGGGFFSTQRLDETLPAPWEWDVNAWRPAARSPPGQNGFDRALSEEAALGAVRTYRAHDQLCQLGALDVYYSRVDTDSLVQVMAAVPRKEIDKVVRGSTTQYRGQGDGQADRHD